jgi:hypothetical protein
MKLRPLLLLLAFAFSISTLFAEKVEINEAAKIATKFYSQKYQMNFPGTTGDIFITSTYVQKENGEDVVYVFNFNTTGYVVIPADDRQFPVLGFSFESDFIFDQVPENCKWVIRDYGYQVTHIRKNNVEPNEATKIAWERYRNDEQLDFIKNNRDIAPMIQALWNQDYPYNALCPADPSGPGGFVYAGCVATAMSMIMYHWRYPNMGIGSHSYYSSYGQLTANFGQTTYLWDAMVNSSDNTVNEPMALIQYHCGVAVDMNYSPDGSGAYSDDVPFAIKNYFGYSNNASYYAMGGMAAWVAYLNQQIIDYQYPVYYSGRDAQVGGGGHAFVCDGLQEQSDVTYYHFNFGWSGSGNGYYLLTDVYGFHYWNAMVRNFIPNENVYPYGAPEEQVVLSYLEGTIEDGSGPKANYEDNISASWLISPQTEQDSVSKIRITFNSFATEAGADFIRVYDGETTDAPMLGEFSGMDIPAEFYSTGNKVLITMTTNESVGANGFKLTYKSIQPTWCSGMQAFSGPSGTFDDGSGTFDYNNGQTCMWTIETQWASSATLYFNYFETEATKDILKVFDLSSQQLLATLSGNTVPNPITSPSGRFYLLFSTNGSVRANGWEVYYEADNVGVGEISGINNLNIYPNPAKDWLTLSFVAQNSDNVLVTMSTIAGSEVYSQKLNGNSGSYYHAMDLSGLNKGVYLLRLQSEAGNLVKKVVIE